MQVLPAETAICGQEDVGADVVAMVVVGKLGGEKKEKWYENNKSSL